MLISPYMNRTTRYDREREIGKKVKKIQLKKHKMTCAKNRKKRKRHRK